MSDDITDFSSRMWTDSPDPVVSTVRTDIIRNRNGPAALWAAVREDDRVKTKSLAESGVSITKGYIHEIVNGVGENSSTRINHANLLKLRDRLRVRLNEAEDSAKKLEDEAQRQFEIGGFAQYNAADKEAKEAKSRIRDIKALFDEAEDLLRGLRVQSDHCGPLART